GGNHLFPASLPIYPNQTRRGHRTMIFALPRERIDGFPAAVPFRQLPAAKKRLWFVSRLCASREERAAEGEFRLNFVASRALNRTGEPSLIFPSDHPEATRGKKNQKRPFPVVKRPFNSPVVKRLLAAARLTNHEMGGCLDEKRNFIFVFNALDN